MARSTVPRSVACGLLILLGGTVALRHFKTASEPPPVPAAPSTPEPPRAGHPGAIAAASPLRHELPTAQALTDSVFFVDSGTGEEVLGVEVVPLRVPEEAARGAFLSKNAIADAVTGPALPSRGPSVPSSLLDDDSSHFLVRHPRYVDVLVPIGEMSGTVRLDPLARIEYTIEREAHQKLDEGIVLLAFPKDPATHASLAQGFVRDDGRFAERFDLRLESPQDSGDLYVAPGTYGVFLDDVGDAQHPWRCPPIVVDAPGRAYLECVDEAALRIEVDPADQGVVWLRSGHRVLRESRLDSEGLAWLPTTSLRDGDYEAGGVGPAWIAPTVPVRVSGGAAVPNRVTLESRRCRSASISVAPASRAARCVLAHVVGDSTRYLSHAPKEKGLAAFRIDATFHVVGLPEHPVEVLLVDESDEGKAVRVLMLEGGGKYPVELPPMQRRVARNAPELVADMTARHGERGVTFSLEEAVELPGKRIVWWPLLSRDFVSDLRLDPHSIDAWVVMVDPLFVRYRLVASLLIEGRSQPIRSVPVEWD